MRVMHMKIGARHDIIGEAEKHAGNRLRWTVPKLRLSNGVYPPGLEWLLNFFLRLQHQRTECITTSKNRIDCWFRFGSPASDRTEPGQHYGSTKPVRRSATSSRGRGVTNEIHHHHQACSGHLFQQKVQSKSRWQRASLSRFSNTSLPE